ncbi:MAG: HAD-IA family hydrolase [Pseudomonadota bacterium]
MKAVFFGSIGSVVETSELQRAAFNAAFVEHGLDWHWDRDSYTAMLSHSGGADRIAQYAADRGVDVDASAVHRTKTARFAELLRSDPPAIRPGVAESLRAARQMGAKTALISTTAKISIDAVLDAHDGTLRGLIDAATDAGEGFAQKPAPDAYNAMFARLGLSPTDVIIVEDNEAGLEAARAAGAYVIAFLGANTQHHDVSSADTTARDDVYAAVHTALKAEEPRAA